MRDEQGGGLPKLLTLQQVRDLFPSAPGQPAPSKRWISDRAKSLRLGKKCGKYVYVHPDFIEQVIKCPTGAFTSTPKKTARKSGTFVADNLCEERMGLSDESRLTVVLAQLQSMKPAKGRGNSPTNTSKKKIVPFPKRKRERGR